MERAGCYWEKAHDEEGVVVATGTWLLGAGEYGPNLKWLC
jgi:hypothetical protein